MYKPCAVTARPISGSGTRGDLGDGEWQVAEGGSNCRCGDRVRLIQGAHGFSSAVVRLITLITRRCWIYTSTFIIIVSNLAPLYSPFPRPSPFFLSCTRTRSPSIQSHPEYHSSIHTYIIILFTSFPSPVHRRPRLPLAPHHRS